MNVRLDRSVPQPSADPSVPSARARRTDRRVLINTGALAGASLWRIVLTFVLQLLIANRLGAGALGQYAAALAYLNVSQVVSDLGLPQLLVRDLARFPGRRRAYFSVALLLQMVAALLVWGALVGLTLLLPFEPSTRAVLVVMTLSLPFYAVTAACETVFQAGERMELVMGVEVTTNLLIFVGSLLILFLGAGTVVHLAAVLIAAQAVAVVLCLFLLRWSGLLGPASAQIRRRPWPILRLLWRRSRPFHGLALANVLLHRLDLLLLSAVAGEIVTGIYSAAYLVVRVFLILSQTYWRSLYPTLSRLRQNARDQYRRLASLGLRYGLMALLLVASVGSAVAEPLLSLVFRGESYEASVPVFQVLIWMAPLFLLATYAGNVLLVERRPRWSLLVASVHLTVTLLLLPPLAMGMQALGASVAVLAAILLSAVAGLWLLHRVDPLLGLPARWPLLWLISAGTVGATLLCARVIPSMFWPVSALLGGLLYALALWRGGFFLGDDFRLFQRAVQR